MRNIRLYHSNKLIDLPVQGNNCPLVIISERLGCPFLHVVHKSATYWQVKANVGCLWPLESNMRSGNKVSQG